ncbi:hypothetical protein EST38_g14067 [Candolleomyces aberdarensis]|uniref:Prefoldin subunit 1 n=1 Tax=Candolleomyces aberdarensis TaxID=2316362 RepID=A0A4Q2CY89_9AGAR|nr:hypothetical protein EST38_g14067 [Candolleomyces aberdarensis]
MATLSDDTLRKILVQIQQSAIQARRSLDISLQQSQAKERERRILQLTIDEITQLPKEVNMYKGVGKAEWMYRFMMVPRDTMEQQLKAQEKELSDDISNLNKKVRRMRDSSSRLKLNAMR